MDSDGGRYTQRLAQLARERQREEARHKEELARLRATQQGLSLELGAASGTLAAEGDGEAATMGKEVAPPPPVDVGVAATDAAVVAAAQAA